MRKIMAMLTVLIAALVLTGCGSGGYSKEEVDKMLADIKEQQNAQTDLPGSDNGSGYGENGQNGENNNSAGNGDIGQTVPEKAPGAHIPDPANGKGTFIIDGQQYTMDVSFSKYNTVDIYFEGQTGFQKPYVSMTVFKAMEEGYSTDRGLLSLWYWDLWDPETLEVVGAARHGDTNESTIDAVAFDGTGNSPSVFYYTFTSVGSDGQKHSGEGKVCCNVVGGAAAGGSGSGGSGSVSIPMDDTCPRCFGRKICQVCNGKGKMSYNTWGQGGTGYVLCEGCKGTRLCESCGGSGKR